MTDDHDAGRDAPPDEAVEAAEARLREAGEPYVLATVVRREAPVSATVGDRAVVTADGIVAGWIGGVGCAETAVIRESRAVLASGEAKLIGLSPDPDDVARPGLEAFPLTCHSGGTLEVFLEPQLTAPRLLVVGGSAIANAVTRGAADLGFDVTVVDPAGGDHPGADVVVATTDYREVVESVGAANAVVVASVGELDARGVAAAVELEAAYVGLVASHRRAEEVTERTADLLGVEPAAVRERVRSPAGLDIGAERPAEIAVSVLAELVAERDAIGVAAAVALDEVPEDDGTVVDPVCGMDVDPDNAVATVDHDGETYYFCCEGCADSFAEAPAEYLGAA